MQKGPRSARFRCRREAVGGVVQFICRLKAAFLARRLQAAVAAGAAVAAVPGGREAAQDAGLGHPAYRPQSPQFRRAWRRSGRIVKS